MGDVYGDDSLRSIINHRLNGLITNEINSCNLIAFFSREIKVSDQFRLNHFYTNKRLMKTIYRI
jgi:hypothetical protein